MAEPPEHLLRVGDDDRERVIDTLHRHARAGRLDPEELDERVGAALNARTFGELKRLTRDLPGEAPPARAVARRSELAKLREHIGSWAAVSVITIAIWAATGAGYFWPMWPIGAIGITVILHVISMLTGRPDEDESA